jgi:hypothetical protein
MSRRATLNLAARLARTTGAGPEFVDALDVCLTPLDRSAWPSVAWGFSRLTTTHFPVEFGFSTHDDRLRATLEVAGPETPDDLRLDAALSLATALGGAAPEAAKVAAWRELQSAAPLRWGCWLSLRQAERGVGVKLYIEAPRGVTAEGIDHLPGSRLHMVGYDLNSRAAEYYFIWPRVGALECGARLRSLVAADAEALIAELESVARRPVATALRHGRLGVSRMDGRAGVALFVDSSTVRGGAVALRPRMMTNRRGGYAALLGDRPDPALPNHGVLTLIPRPEGVELRTSIAADALQ